MLVPADARLLDTLAVFGVEAEDREMDLEDEPQADDEPSIGGPMDDEREFDDCDLEDDFPAERRCYIEGRQLPGTSYGGIARDRYNASKDWDELRRVQAFVARSPIQR